MRINIYRLKAWKNGGLIYEFNFEFKDSGYHEIKKLLRFFGYRVQELFAWN